MWIYGISGIYALALLVLALASRRGAKGQGLWKSMGSKLASWLGAWGERPGLGYKLAKLGGGDQACLTLEYRAKKYALAMLLIGLGCLFALLAQAKGGQVRAKMEEGRWEKSLWEGEPLELEAEVEGEWKGRLSWELAPKSWTKEEMEVFGKQCYGEVLAYLEEQSGGLERVEASLDLPAEWGEYPFSLAWTSSHSQWMSAGGRLLALPESPVDMELELRLSLEDWEQRYSIPLRLAPAEGQWERRLEDALDMAAASQAYESHFRPPEQVGGRGVVWRRRSGSGAGRILALFGLAAALVFWGMDQDVERLWNKRRQEMEEDYPMVAGKLAIYVQAGLPIRKAFERIAGEGGGRGRPRAIHEEMAAALREIGLGASEIRAYEHMGQRTDLASYIRLAALLGQNVRRGSGRLAERLEQEAKEAGERQLERRRKEGEELGTKLLLPMMCMLTVVMAMVILPAFFALG